MAHTDIIIRDPFGDPVPNLPTLAIAAGNTVTFRSPDANTTLYFSPDLIGILSPSPGPSTALSASGELSYSFTAATPGLHCIIIQAPGGPAPVDFGGPDFLQSTMLILHGPAHDISFGVISNSIET